MLKQIGLFGLSSPIIDDELHFSGRMNNAIALIALKKNLALEKVNSQSEAIQAQVLIDFSIPETTRTHFELAQKFNKPILICTTGHQDITFLTDTGVPTCYAPNTCIEWLLMKQCILQIAELNTDSQAVIEDIHSPLKKDKPSGTGLNLYNSLANIMTPENLHLTSIRKLEVPSWHKCDIYCENQTLSFGHQVLNREIYASGAIKLAELLLQRDAGLYTPEELLSRKI